MLIQNRISRSRSISTLNPFEPPKLPFALVSVVSPTLSFRHFVDRSCSSSGYALTASSTLILALLTRPHEEREFAPENQGRTLCPHSSHARAVSRNQRKRISIKEPAQAHRPPTTREPNAVYRYRRERTYQLVLPNGLVDCDYWSDEERAELDDYVRICRMRRSGIF